MRSRNYLLLLVLILSACDNSNDTIEDDTSVRYSFFVAGHTYGNANNPQLGLHPPLIEHIEDINNLPSIKLGVLTGDIVKDPQKMYFDAVVSDMDQFDMPIHVAAGNHDRGDLFLDYFPEYYYSEVIEDDLFVILSPTAWNIEGDQKLFLESTIEAYKDKVNNIFIFVHELIWWSPDNKFGKVEINWRPHYPGSTNYWTEIEPMLRETNKSTVIYAGDLGTTSRVDAYMYYQEGNITYIANGMGGGVEDNIIVTYVNNLGLVEFDLLGLNSDSLYEIIELSEYKLPE